MDYKKAHRLFDTLWYGGGIIIILFLWVKIDWVAIIGIMMMVVGMFFSETYYRCPYCQKKLSIRDEEPEYCPQCGRKLD